MEINYDFEASFCHLKGFNQETNIYFFFLSVRTPTFGHLQAVLPGLEVIRAFNIERMIIYEADTFLNRHTGAWHMYIGCIYWMKLRFNWLVTAYLAVVLTIALASPSNGMLSTSRPILKGGPLDTRRGGGGLFFFKFSRSFHQDMGKKNIFPHTRKKVNKGGSFWFWK